MKRIFQIAGIGVVFLGTMGISRAAAQDPILTPIIVDTAAPIIISAITPKPKVTGLAKFQGYVMHASRTQITVLSLIHI